MAQLEFDLAAVRTLCKHALAADAWTMGYSDEDPRPGLLLVGDQGVYLMSNGQPGLMKEEGEGHVVVHAKGINPHVDPFDTWWEAKRATFGGNDGAEFCPWAVTILKMIGQARDATRLLVEISDNSLELKGVA